MAWTFITQPGFGIYQCDDELYRPNYSKDCFRDIKDLSEGFWCPDCFEEGVYTWLDLTLPHAPFFCDRHQCCYKKDWPRVQKVMKIR